MREKVKSEKTVRAPRRRRVWPWVLVLLIVVCGSGAVILHELGYLKWRGIDAVINTVMPNDENINIVATDVAVAPVDTVQVADAESSDIVIRPACAVIEDALLAQIVDDDNPDWQAQFDSSRVYATLAQRGCAQNAKFFSDMSVRKQTIAEGLRAVYDQGSDEMTSVEYLYSDEKICQTIENRVLQNINVNAYSYDEFLRNANTYSVLYEYGCRDNKIAYSRASIRELAIALALVPADKMTQDEIITVVEVYKRLGAPTLAHLVLQRLKARGYDMDFLLSLENIIHGMR